MTSAGKNRKKSVHEQKSNNYQVEKKLNKEIKKKIKFCSVHILTVSIIEK